MTPSTNNREKQPLTKVDRLEDPTLDALADRVMHANVEFDAQLDTRGRRFPAAEHDKLWEAVLEYPVFDTLGLPRLYVSAESSTRSNRRGT